MAPVLSAWIRLFALLSILQYSGAAAGQLSPKNQTLSQEDFNRFEELARFVDITYCVGIASPGIQEPFQCPSRCSDFPNTTLVTTWESGPLLSDSCGYIAVTQQSGHKRIIIAFRGTYSIANAITDLSTVPQKYEPYGSDNSSCYNCTVHSGFQHAWQQSTRPLVLDTLHQTIAQYPDHELTVLGHSLGGAIACLASLDFLAQGWNTTAVTFGEPRVGNEEFAHFVDASFGVPENGSTVRGQYHRITHVGDPVPLVPLRKWGYASHAGEIFIMKESLSPNITDLRVCDGREDPQCSAGDDLWGDAIEPLENTGMANEQSVLWWPTLRKILQSLSAHRDYFWRLGLCLPHIWG